MKKTRTFSIILIVLSVLFAAVITVGVIFALPLFAKEESELSFTTIDGTEMDIHNGYADVTLYGAVPNDGKDDTEPFLNAAKTGASIYVPIGEFNIKKTIELNGQSLKGAGMENTKITFSGNGNILSVKSSVIVEDIALSYDKDTITGTEENGEKVAIFDNGLSNLSVIRAVKLSNVGTGFYSADEKEPNSALTVESVIIDGFSNKAFDIKSSYGTLFRSVFVKNAGKKVKTAALLGGTFTFESFAFEGVEADHLLELSSADSAVIRSLLIKDCTANSGNAINSISSMISAETVTVINSSVKYLVDINDRNGVDTKGSITILYGDNADLKADEENIIVCDSKVG